MASLERNLRKDLERAVKKARNVAEAGARQAIAQLGVGEAEAPKHLTAEQRTLRNGLRAHGRQLGDRRDPKTGAQVTTRLAQECAYEHWHRMLFARFLAETDLLIEPDSGVAITLEEVQELAREKGVDWLPLASEYAERMLPQIFSKDDPVLDIALPPETRSELEDLLKALPKAVFEADDSLGWVYQFWQGEKKEEVNKSEVKIGADELPTVTQLFTEDYMVLFLLHNTLGAWWAGKVLAENPGLATSATSEDTLRAACRVGDVAWNYLRFVRDGAEDGAEGQWRPAAGTFEGWPKTAKDITLLDPCMGSGHFLVFALPILVGFRMAEEGLSERDAIDAALRDNLFGLEIDPRCTQIAAFNLAFAAWRRTGFHTLPQLNLACSGLAIGVTKAEWLKLAEKAVMVADPAAKRDLLGVEQNLLTHGLEERVKNGLEALYDLFAKAPWLGSLIDPRRAGGDIFRVEFEQLEPLLASILAAADTDDAREMAVAAKGMAKAAELLGERFTLVVTNVPYLGRLKQDEVIKQFCEDTYPEAKADLAACFVERCQSLCTTNAGTTALVTPQIWWFLTTYTKLRKKLLQDATWNIAISLGEEAWWTFGMRGPRTVLTVLSACKPKQSSEFFAIDVATNRGEIVISLDEKAAILAGEKQPSLYIVNQLNQLGNPDASIVFQPSNQSSLLMHFADSHQGAATLDIEQFRLMFYEIDDLREWRFHQSSPTGGLMYSGAHYISADRSPGGRFHRTALLLESEKRAGAPYAGNKVWNSKGVACAWMGYLPTAIYLGAVFDNSIAAIVPHDPRNLPAVWCFCFSNEFATEVRKINQKNQVANATLVKVPFDLARWQSVAAEKYPNGLPEPFSKDPSQWIFDGQPKSSDHPLQVGIAIALGYRWPRQSECVVPCCSPVSADNVEKLGDDDGIACINAIKGEPTAYERIVQVLAPTLGAEWSAAKLASLLSEAGYAGKSLDDWLRDGFFAQHCELFHQRPFIWHIWDGRRDGFHALVNYHRLAAPNGEGRRTLEKLIYSYLGDWIDRQRADQTAGLEGADARLAHAEHLRGELIKILEGEPPYDIFVRWKPLHEQPIGWDPDINDGVRMNIRPFTTARPLGAKAKGACILRATPKIKWDKDRGKEPGRDKIDYPWFWGWDEASADFAGGATFDGNRWNDLHYSRDVKQAARDQQAAKAGAKP